MYFSYFLCTCQVRRFCLYSETCLLFFAREKQQQLDGLNKKRKLRAILLHPVNASRKSLSVEGSRT